MLAKVNVVSLLVAGELISRRLTLSEILPGNAPPVLCGFAHLENEIFHTGCLSLKATCRRP